jgi:serine/threonine protein kinase/Tfp pilus assembly protein PilF
MTLSPGSKLGPYEILSAIGSGGMGEVWKARDTRLGRTVAIKKVREQHSERFKQEARSIAALNHPNICQIHDIGDDYLVLEYVEGKPLSSPLPEQEAVRLAIQITTALEEAHQHGIIHRDLKPSNIMVTDKGSVKLLDFGLAKLYEQNQSISNMSTEDFPATQVGAILGTVAYMSPEQAQGQLADTRSDIFSFGLVLYEMLSGRRAFSGDSASETIAALLRDEPVPLKASPQLEQIVKQCLEKKPSERYQTMAEVKVSLEKATAKKMAASSEEPQPSIAVLPFVNMSGDKEQEYFSDGLAEEIINALTQISGLKVIARTSAFSFKGKEQDIRKIAEALNVSNIFEGSVRKAGNRIRVTAQLITASDGSHLWSERYDRDLTDVFAIQDEISQTIVNKLSVRLVGDRSLAKQYTGNIEAYNLYLKGRHHLFRLSPEHMSKSKEYFEQAIAVNPAYAQPWHGLAAIYYIMGAFAFMLPKTANSQSRQAILKALELDDTLPEAHGHLAALLAFEFDWQGTEREFRRALELGPENSDVWLQYGLYYLRPMRRTDEAFAALKKASELDPLSAFLQGQLGIQLLAMRQYDQALKQIQNALDLDPHFVLAHFYLGVAYIVEGRFEKAIHAIEVAIQSFGRIPLLLGFLGFIYARMERITETQQLLEELSAITQKNYVPGTTMAMIYIGLGEIDKAFDWLERAIEERDSMILTLFRSAFFDPLRSHPRYKALLRKMNLEP